MQHILLPLPIPKVKKLKLYTCFTLKPYIILTILIVPVFYCDNFDKYSLCKYYVDSGI